MLKLVRRYRGKTSDGHIKDKHGQDLFLFNKTIEHGFPHKPSALAHDPKLQLLAIGTEDGTLRIYGKPGVQLTARHQEETRIQELHFLPEQGRIISVCDDGEQNSIHLWEVNKKEGKSVLEEVKTCTLEGRLKKISVCSLSMKTNRLLLGTEGGNIYLLDINSFELQDYVIYQDVVMQSVEEENKTNAGSVEAIQEHPEDSNKILIGYKKGLIVMWNHESCNVQHTFPNSIDLESISWEDTGSRFVSSHADGSQSIWSVGDEAIKTEETSTPFGPFPCKAITKVEWHDNHIFFAGGMPRASYGDKNCVSLMHGSTTQVVFDFSSRVIEFLVIRNPESDEPVCLAVLCEQEFVVIDLKTKEQGYPTFMQPYLICLHSSPITTSFHCHGCPSELWDQIATAGREQMRSEYSVEAWPVTGGKSLLDSAEKKDILVTGHEDGSVRFWDVSHVDMQLMYSLHTSKLFVSDHEGHDNGAQEVEEEGWPPFKKVGNYDPFTDDPRFAVQKILLCGESKTLIVAGNGGQVVEYNISDDEAHVELQVTEIDLVEDKEKLQWKGHGPLATKEGQITVPRGFQPKTAVQVIPAAPVTALAYHAGWGVLAVGTCHGFGLLDLENRKVVTTKCTVSEEELSNTGEPISRKKSLKKSIRDSFRRLRRSRKGTKTPKKDGEGEAGPSSPAETAPPVQRLVHENRVDETVLSMVRCIYFVDTFLKDGVHHTPSMWVGTNAGQIFVFNITLPGEEDKEEGIKAEMGKEIKLRHKAPVVAIFVVDKDGLPLLGELPEEGAEGSGQHSLVICSEEQFKVFSLPHLKARHKEKLTAVDGSRVRKIGIINAHSKNDDSGMVYHCLACLSNQGDLCVYSIPHLKLQLKVPCMKKEDIIAIQSLVFTSSGQGFYLRSPSELQRFSLTASDLLKPECVLELAEGMRPPEEVTIEVTEETSEKGERKDSSSSSSSSSSSDDEKDEEKKAAKKAEKKKRKLEKKAEEEAAAATATAAAVTVVVEEKKEEVIEKSEEAEVEAAPEEPEAAPEEPDSTHLEEETSLQLVIQPGNGTSVTTEQKVESSSHETFHHQTESSEEKGMKEENSLQSEEQTVEESESSRSVVTTKRMVTSTRVVKHTTSHRIVSSDGETIETIEGIENLQIQNGDGEEKAVNDTEQIVDEMDGLEFEATKRRSKGKGFTSPGKLNTRRSGEMQAAQNLDSA